MPKRVRMTSGFRVKKKGLAPRFESLGKKPKKKVGRKTKKSTRKTSKKTYKKKTK